jgi:hypothetical protein
MLELFFATLKRCFPLLKQRAPTRFSRSLRRDGVSHLDAETWFQPAGFRRIIAYVLDSDRGHSGTALDLIKADER